MRRSPAGLIGWPHLAVLALIAIGVYFLVASASYAEALSKKELRALFADKLPPGTSSEAATWIQGNHFLPSSALRDGASGHLAFFARGPNWEEDIQTIHLKKEKRLPAVIFLHGCNGFTTGRYLVTFFLEEGYAVFAPNSFARPGRVAYCEDPSFPMAARIQLRLDEMRFALSKIRELKWIDNSRLVLAGFSEGAQAVSSWDGPEFMAHVLFGTDCRFVGGAPEAPADVPVLNIVGFNDEYGYGDGCRLSSNHHAASRRVVIQGIAHDLSGTEEPRREVASFLQSCCAK